MAQQGQLIVLSGIDGSGKSSHLQWVSRALLAGGIPFHYVRLRWAAYTSLPLIAAARAFGYSERHLSPRSGTVIVEPRYHEWSLMRATWPKLFALDMTLAARRQVLGPLARGEWVLCDRYTLDGLVDLAATLHDAALLESRVGAQLLGLIPAGTRSLILDTDPQLAFARKLDVPNLEFLTARQALYRVAARKLGTPLIDGNRPFAAVQSDIATLLGLAPLAGDLGRLPEVAA